MIGWCWWCEEEGCGIALPGGLLDLIGVVGGMIFCFRKCRRVTQGLLLSGLLWALATMNLLASVLNLCNELRNLCREPRDQREVSMQEFPEDDADFGAREDGRERRALSEEEWS